MLKTTTLRTTIAAVLAGLSMSAPAIADTARMIKVPAGELVAALESLAKQADIELVYQAEQLRGIQTAGVYGTYEPRQAVSLLLKGTPLILRTDEATGVMLVAQPTAAKTSAAQDASPTRPQETIELEEIVVTGTHIRGSAPIGSALSTIRRDEIRASGHGRVQDYLESLPQNFSGSAGEDLSTDAGAANLTRGQAIDLRGLGAGSTLVLVNGRRQAAGGLEGSFVDVSSIPTAAVERIEILTDGASALYGSDAVGGVVNIVLRKDYEGLETEVRFATAQGAAEELRFSQLAGHGWDGGSALVGYQYSQRDALMASDTFYGSKNWDFRSLGGSDFRVAAGTPGTILDPATRLPAFAIPDQDGTNLSASELIAGAANYRDNVTGIAVLPEQEQHSAFFAVSNEIGRAFEVFAEGRYSRRNMVLPFTNPSSQLSVPASNPFYVNPSGTGPVIVFYSFREDLGGVTTQVGETDTYTLSTGGVARLTADWELNVAAGYAREHNTWESRNGINPTRIRAALLDQNPATALNVFGNGTANNPSTIDSIRLTSVASGLYEVGSLTAIADGPVLNLPAGLVRVAVGADARDESLESTGGTLEAASGVFTRDPTPVGSLQRQVKAVFGELTVPIVGVDGAARHGPRLDAALAARYEDYSDFGSTLDPKVGLRFALGRGLSFRGSWGTSFRAPRFNEMSPTNNPTAAQGSFSVQDPKSPTGRSNILLLSGGNPDLREETADIWTLGFDLTVLPLSGASLTMTYFNIDYQDKIQIGGDSINTLLREDVWAEIIARDPSPAQVQEICDRPDFRGDCPAQPAAIIDTRLRNLAGIRVEGVDFDWRYRSAAGYGNLNFGLAGTYLLEYGRAVSSQSRFIDVADTVGNPPELRLRAIAAWEAGGWRASLVLNYVDDYRGLAADTVASWTSIDSSLAYQFDDRGWLHGTHLQLSVVNALNQEPPFVDQSQGFDPANANQIGRSISLTMTKDW